MEISSSTHTHVFLALPVDSVYHAALRRLQSELIQDLAYLPHLVRWTQPPRLHLTLFFLGKHAAEDIQRLIQVMEKTDFTQLSLKIDLHCTQVELFPPSKPTVVALTGNTTPALMRLREEMMNCLRKAQIQPDLSPETHGFLPHITLGRLEEPTDLKSQPIDMKIDFKKLVLFKSELIDPPRSPYVKHTPLHSSELTILTS